MNIRPLMKVSGEICAKFPQANKTNYIMLGFRNVPQTSVFDKTTTLDHNRVFKNTTIKNAHRYDNCYLLSTLRHFGREI